ncbi:MAG: major facilitator superfamily protein [Planctomycetota bacterium]|nr:MAG: major facilitator superfamily protein [Planctomycetota bacterium]
MSGLLGFAGLQLLGDAEGVMWCIIAATVYSCGKTFLWPTMLAVASERFPKGGAITIGAIGGMGMLSAGLLGGPGIGFKQDYYASGKLKEESPAIYERYKSDEENHFLAFKVVGLDGSKVGVLDDGGKELARANEILKKEGKSDKNQEALATWWADSEKTSKEDKPKVGEAGLHGGRKALKVTSLFRHGLTACGLFSVSVSQ